MSTQPPSTEDAIKALKAVHWMLDHSGLSLTPTAEKVRDAIRALERPAVHFEGEMPDTYQSTTPSVVEVQTSPTETAYVYGDFSGNVEMRMGQRINTCTMCLKKYLATEGVTVAAPHAMDFAYHACPRCTHDINKGVGGVTTDFTTAVYGEMNYGQ